MMLSAPGLVSVRDDACVLRLFPRLALSTQPVARGVVFCRHTSVLLVQGICPSRFGPCFAFAACACRSRASFLHAECCVTFLLFPTLSPLLRLRPNSRKGSGRRYSVSIARSLHAHERVHHPCSPPPPSLSCGTHETHAHTHTHARTPATRRDSTQIHLTRTACVLPPTNEKRTKNQTETKSKGSTCR